MLYLKMPELHIGVSVLEHGHCFPAMTLGSIDLYSLYDSESTRLQVTGHSGEVIIYNMFVPAIHCPTFGGDKTAGRVLEHSKPGISGWNSSFPLYPS